MRLRPRRLRMRLTVAGETPASAAICLPVQRWRRSASTCSTIAGGVGLSQAMRPRGAIRQARPAPSASKRATHLRTVRGQTPAARAAASGVCPLNNLPHHSLSTMRRQTGILMDVHPVLRGITEASQPQLPRSGPDGQPIESSQLEALERARPLTLPPSHAKGLSGPWPWRAIWCLPGAYPDRVKHRRLNGVLNSHVFSGAYGGRYWTRTSDPCDVNTVLYQLS